MNDPLIVGVYREDGAGPFDPVDRGADVHIDADTAELGSDQRAEGGLDGGEHLLG